MNLKLRIFLLIVVVYDCLIWDAESHGPPLGEERPEEPVVSRKTSSRWCNMARTCAHDRVAACGASAGGDVVGFRDVCDMYDYNCLRKRNYKQISCPDDRSMLSVSRRPPSYYDD